MSETKDSARFMRNQDELYSSKFHPTVPATGEAADDIYERDAPAEKYPVPVVCAVILRDGEVLLERRATTGVEGLDRMWDVPGGKMELDETPQQAITREVNEEQGVQVLAYASLPLRSSTWVYHGRRRFWLLVPYVCKLVGGAPKLTDDLRWWPVSALPEEMLAADRGMVIDALNLYADRCILAAIAEVRQRDGERIVKVEAANRGMVVIKEAAEERIAEAHERAERAIEAAEARTDSLQQRINRQAEIIGKRQTAWHEMKDERDSLAATLEKLIPCQSPDHELCDNQGGHPRTCHCLDPLFWKKRADSLAATLEKVRETTRETIEKACVALDDNRIGEVGMILLALSASLSPAPGTEVPE